MSKFRAPRAGKTSKKGWAGAAPCLVIVLTVFGLTMMLFYWGLQSQ